MACEIVLSGSKLACTAYAAFYRKRAKSALMHLRRPANASSRPLIHLGILIGRALRNAWVGGSIPSCGTNKINDLAAFVGLIELDAGSGALAAAMLWET